MRNFGYDVSLQTVGVEVGRQDTLGTGVFKQFSLAGNYVATLHLADRIFLARNHISEEQ